MPARIVNNLFCVICTAISGGRNLNPEGANAVAVILVGYEYRIWWAPWGAGSRPGNRAAAGLCVLR